MKPRDIISEAMSQLAHRKNKSLTARERKEAATKAITARWAKMTPEERSEQAKRRWRKIKAKQRKGRKSKS